VTGPRRRRAASLLALLLVAAACTSDGGPPPVTAPADTTATSAPATTTTTTSVPIPEPAPIAWRACGAFDCATVTVPIDYLDPATGTIDLAVIRRPADDPTRRIGSVIINPGGPGSSGVRRVQRGFDVSAEVAERFDVVGFDPRGVGESHPISCGRAVPAFRAADLAPDTPEEVAALESAAQAVADECAATEGPLLGHLGTVDVARDVEVIRKALGEPEVSFLGISYGTFIGLLWAEAFPQSVRALVLDGVVDPSSGGEATSKDQIRAVDSVLQAVDASCVADAACPLRRYGGVQSAYDEVARRAEAGAATGAGVGPTQVTYAGFMATYGSDQWPGFIAALASALDGRWGGIRSMAEAFTDLVPYAPFAVITCLDAPHPVGAAAWRADAVRSARVSSRFGAALANELLPCAFLPEGTFQPHRVVAEGTPPILVVGSTGDAATPYQQAEEVAHTLAEGVLLTVHAEGHVALGDSECATAAITRYLVDLALPAADC
jgi:pimeloyl-ACP methyl ester carboxylesterase